MKLSLPGKCPWFHADLLTGHEPDTAGSSHGCPGRRAAESAPYLRISSRLVTSARPQLRRRARGTRRGAVLLEVVLALVLLAGAAAVIGAGLGRSIDSVERQRLNMHAANLASSVLAEVQLGLRTPGNGPQPFEVPFEHWSWELHTAPVESSLGHASDATPLTLIEAVVRHDDPAVVHRLARIIRSRSAKP